MLVSLRDRRVPGSKPDSTKNPSCMWVWCALNLTLGVSPLVGLSSSEREYCLTCLSRRLNRVQNEEVRVKSDFGIPRWWDEEVWGGSAGSRVVLVV
ncbi:hypothetical protein AVEN_249356-1 [Araneus ventricosus]|uniref:Uncharacterized protein n=1 Tax=Araneus ventricosus TaxID=182803 RepID=A0A4Y2JP18_ARAVE|nr:hypothetical protein AVEN_249356-1 [Araneus ventricosus]